MRQEPLTFNISFDLVVDEIVKMKYKPRTKELIIWFDPGNGGKLEKEIFRPMWPVMVNKLREVWEMQQHTEEQLKHDNVHQMFPR